MVLMTVTLDEKFHEEFRDKAGLWTDSSNYQIQMFIKT